MSTYEFRMRVIDSWLVDRLAKIGGQGFACSAPYQNHGFPFEAESDEAAIRVASELAADMRKTGHFFFRQPINLRRMPDGAMIWRDEIQEASFPKEFPPDIEALAPPHYTSGDFDMAASHYAGGGK